MSRPVRKADDDDDDGAGYCWIMQVVAIYDYEPDERDEIAFQEGDVIRVVRVQKDGWWQGYLVDDEPGRLGMFPSNYVKVQHHRPQQGKSPLDAPLPRQCIHQQKQQQNPRVHFSVRNGAEDGDPDDEDKEQDDDDEGQPAAVQMSARKSSVLELKQRLADAERNSRAAQDARRKAEQQQQPRRRQPMANTSGARRHCVDEDEQDGDDGDQDDNGFYTQEQWRQQSGRVEDNDQGDDDDQGAEGQEDDGERGDDEDEEEPDDDNEKGDDEEDDEDDNEDNGRGGEDEDEAMGDVTDSHANRNARAHTAEEEQDAATRIARRYRVHSQHDREKRSRDEERRRKASHVITHSMRQHVQRSRDADEQRQRQRQSTAALAIQRWLVQRASSARVRLAFDEEGATLPIYKAATRIQQWMRHRIAYLRWLEHVEAERKEMLRLKELKEKRVEQEQERKRQEQEQERQRRAQEEKEKKQEAKRRRAQQRQDELDRQQAQEATTATILDVLPPISDEKRARKRVMKKEAVELVKTLVSDQLNEKLRSHDDQMMELQRMMSRLQDVIRQQSSMIQSTTDQLLELEHQQHQPAVVHQKQRQIKPPAVATASSSAANETSRPKQPHTTTATTALPQLIQPVATGPSSAMSRPSGIKPPRPFERPTVLPLLASSGNNPSNVIKT